MNLSPFTLALIQMRVEGGESKRNLDRASRRIAEAADAGANIALLPEALDLGWTHPSSQTEAAAIPGGHAFTILARAAKERGIHVCAGLTELADDGRVFNAAVLIGPEGDLLLKHRKLNELEIGHACYAQGDRLGVAATDLGTLGVMICADGFAKDHVVSRTLGYMGADVILSPCAWAVPADHDNDTSPYGAVWRDCYIPVAREFSLWIAAASNVGAIRGGPWDGRQCIGASLVIDADGDEVLQGPYGADADTILSMEITPKQRPARGDAWREK